MHVISRAEADVDDQWQKGAGDELSYDALRRSFEWHIPPTFNFGSDVIDAFARERDGLALICEDERGQERRYRYSDLSRLSNRFANLLRGLGVAKGDRVLVMLPRIPEWPVAIIGAMKLGAIPIPSIEMLTPHDLRYRLENSKAAAIVCRAEHSGKFEGIAGAVRAKISVGEAPGWHEWAAAMESASDLFEPATVSADDPAIMYYTSGSTGHPKAVLHAARAIYAWRNSARYWLDLRAGDRMWCTADTGWSKAGTSILFGPWSCGACSFIYEGPFVAAERLRLIAKHAINVFCASATELSLLLSEDFSGHDLSALRRTVTAGEALNPAVGRRWEAATGIRVDEAYGQTEALMLTLNVPGEPVHYGSMGRPLPGVDLAVIDEGGVPLEVGEEGDLALRLPNPQFMLGYWHETGPQLPPIIEASDGGWYVTGDRARFDENGYLWYRGRSDDIINSAGYRIGPLEVESALLEHPAVQACAVVGSPDQLRGEVVKAFIVLRSGYAPTDSLTAELQAHSKALATPYKYPRRIEFVDSLPMTATGKISRKILREREAAKPSSAP